MVMLNFWEVSVLESFASAFRGPVTGFGDGIHGAVNVLAMRMCGRAEEAELEKGYRPC
jgi:hypothetical protein